MCDERQAVKKPVNVFGYGVTQHLTKAHSAARENIPYKALTRQTPVTQLHIGPYSQTKSETSKSQPAVCVRGRAGDSHSFHASLFQHKCMVLLSEFPHITGFWLIKIADSGAGACPAFYTNIF